MKKNNGEGKYQGKHLGNQKQGNKHGMDKDVNEGNWRPHWETQITSSAKKNGDQKQWGKEEEKVVNVVLEAKESHTLTYQTNAIWFNGFSETEVPINNSDNKLSIIRLVEQERHVNGAGGVWAKLPCIIFLKLYAC